MSEETNQFQEKMNDYHAQGEEYVRANPSQAVLSAVVAGFILRLLPLTSILSALVRLAVFAAKPALFIYGATTLYKHFQANAEAKQP